MTRRTLIPVVAALLLAAHPALAQETREADGAEVIYATPIAFIAGHTQAVNYELGRGVPHDYARAADLYRVTAELGYAESQNDLAKLYHDGRGVPQDFVKAYYWYSRSAAQGNACAILDRELLRPRMTTAQIAEAEERVGEWKPEHE